MTNRNTIFISHGNPEDNVFAEWLAARLTGAGYQVWIDLWHGKGHPTWEEIEEEIRVRSIRVVALVSRLGAAKPGFKDEINAASGIRRQLQDSAFILPIRLDDISFQSEIPIQIGRLNFIDGNSIGWDEILAQLLEQLAKDGIPRRAIDSTTLYEAWLSRRKAAMELVSRNTETVFTNWFIIDAFPKTINFYSSESLHSSWVNAVSNLKFPKRFENGILCTFAEPDDVRMGLPLGIKVKCIARVEIDEFISGKKSAPLYSAREDSTRALVDLFRQGFSRFAESRDLKFHQLSRRACWYHSSDGLGANRIPFDVNGFTGARKLTGRHKEFYWHYATSFDLAWTPPVRATASGHVLFSIDGKQIISDVKIAAKLRRKAVRSKRNAWWRDVMLAYFACLSSEDEWIRIPMGGKTEIRLASSPIAYTSPLRLEFDSDYTVVSDDPIEESDADDDLDEEESDDVDESNEQ